jgi:hypothetical protein
VQDPNASSEQRAGSEGEAGKANGRTYNWRALSYSSAAELFHFQYQRPPSNMHTALLIIFIICFLIEIIPNGVLIHIDVETQLKSESNLGRDYRWDRALGVLFGVVQIVLSVGNIVLTVYALLSRRGECRWLDVGIVCNVQLLAGVNVRTYDSVDRSCLTFTQLSHILKYLYQPNWAIRLAYATSLAIALLM